MCIRDRDYAEGLGYNVVGAINADFGYWETRIPCGMVVEDGVYKSSPEGNSAKMCIRDSLVAYYLPLPLGQSQRGVVAEGAAQIAAAGEDGAGHAARIVQ